MNNYKRINEGIPNELYGTTDFYLHSSHPGLFKSIQLGIYFEYLIHMTVVLNFERKFDFFITRGRYMIVTTSR